MTELNPYSYSEPGSLDQCPQFLISDNDTGRVMRGLLDSRQNAKIASYIFAAIGLIHVLTFLWSSISLGSFTTMGVMTLFGLFYFGLNLVLSIVILVLAVSLRKYVNAVNDLEQLLTIRQVAVAVEKQRFIFFMLAIVGGIYLLLATIPLLIMVVPSLLR